MKALIKRLLKWYISNTPAGKQQPHWRKPWSYDLLPTDKMRSNEDSEI